MAELADVFKAFAPHLPADLPFLGPDQVEQQKSAPSISWEPFSASHRPPQGLGGGRKGPEGPLWTRALTVNVRIWGESHSQTEQLLIDFINAVHTEIPASYGLEGERWSRSGPGMSSGFEVVLSLVLLIPVPRTAAARRPLTQIDTTFKLNDEAV
jgi:hypothetical protein